MANKHGPWSKTDKKMAEQVIYLLHRYNSIEEILEAMEQDFEDSWIRFRIEAMGDQ